MMLGLPPIINGVLRVESDTTDMRQWLPDRRAERKQYDRFVEHFGPDDFVVVSWPGCTLREFVGWSGIVALSVALLSLRSVRLTLIVVLTGAYCGGLSVALIYYSGMRFNALMLVLPTLVHVLTISNAVHLVNYYQDAVCEHGMAGAAGRALAVGWLPCTLASVTTAIGMMSLVASQIRHVRTFGVYAATSLLLSLMVLCAFVPVALMIRIRFGDGPRLESSKLISPHAIDRFAAVVLRHHAQMLAGMGFLLVVFAIGLDKTSSSVKIERMFPQDNELVRNYQWFEDRIGPLAALEIVVGFDEDCALSTHDRLVLVRQLSRGIESLPNVGKTFSAATLAPSTSGSSGLRAALRRAIVNRRLNDAIPQLKADGVLAEGGGAQFWRVTVRIPALRDLDYVPMIDAVDQKVQATLGNGRASTTSIEVSYTGTILVMNQARRQLLGDLVKTFAAAFVLICPLMMLILRSVVAGFLSMIPNLVPAILVFGGMGWLGIPIDIGTVLTACVALGIAVDDTLHFLTWYRRALRSGDEPREAIRVAYRRCAVAMIQTTMICGFGLLVFAGSSFVPTSRFAVLMFALLMSALLGDLVLLTALLAGPFGRFMGRRDSFPRSAALGAAP